MHRYEPHESGSAPAQDNETSEKHAYKRAKRSHIFSGALRQGAILRPIDCSRRPPVLHHAADPQVVWGSLNHNWTSFGTTRACHTLPLQ
jgi:hypothetical protein